MTLDLALRCIARALTLIAMQHVGLDSILVFPVLHPGIWSQNLA